MKILTMMMMMMLVQVASAHEDVDLWTKTWELTLVMPDEMLDMPVKFHSYPLCVAHGVQIMMTPETRRSLILGFVCEKEEDDENL